MQQLNAKEVKQKITKFMEEKGPVLPVNVAKHLGMNTLFASAFLSELASEKTIKISSMKVGGSPLYYTPSKTSMLENFIVHLSGKEKEACSLLKEKEILDDSKQHPAIRVALRALKDFAIPFKKDSQIFWRYFTVSEDKVRDIIEPKEKKAEPLKSEVIEPKLALEKQIEAKNEERTELEKIRQELVKEREEISRLKKQIEEKHIKQKKENSNDAKAKKPKAKIKPKVDERFLNEIKQLLAAKHIEILSLEHFDKKQVLARVRISDNEHLLAAYDKKRVDDADILRTYKKASSLNLPYYILSKGDASKKTKEAIEAYKKLASIDIIEQTDANQDTQKQSL